MRSVVQICLSAPKGSESSLIRNLLHNFEEYAQREKLIQIEKARQPIREVWPFIIAYQAELYAAGRGMRQIAAQ